MKWQERQKEWEIVVSLQRARIAELEKELREADKYFEGLQMGFGREPILITQWRERARKVLVQTSDQAGVNAGVAAMMEGK